MVTCPECGLPFIPIGPRETGFRHLPPLAVASLFNDAGGYRSCIPCYDCLIEEIIDEILEEETVCTSAGTN